ncbi:MAG: hypothetical protein ACSHYF_13485 [Verrucomicrobiaceae bacterium]
MTIIRKTTLGLFSAASLVAASTAQAGDLSASLSLDANSHFISYGFDVWGAGDDQDILFNPSLSLDYKLNDCWTLNTGFWLDVNDKPAGSSFRTQETDTWIGFAYSKDIYSVSATYQSWQYAGDTEQILDVSFALDTFLSPSITWHNRLDPGASGGFNGSFLVFGAEHSFDINEKLSVSIPVSVGFALSEFHTVQDGYGYASVGLQGSYAINDTTAFNFGMTYYDTDSGVVGNAEDSFVTYNAGVSFSF